MAGAQDFEIAVFDSLYYNKSAMPDYLGQNPSEYPPSEISRYMAVFSQRREEMRRVALKAREKAVSHRGFHVGSAVLAVKFNPDGSEIFEIYPGANYTPEKKRDEEIKAETKWCSERVAINLALAERAKFIVGIVTVSDRKNDEREQGEQANNVLCTCPQCKELLRHLLEEGIIFRETKICNINDSNGNFIKEETTAGELLNV